MKDLTDDECDALDEYYTKNMPKVDFSKNDGYTKKTPNVVIVDEFSGKLIHSLRVLCARFSSVKIQTSVIALISRIPPHAPIGLKTRALPGCF